MDTIYALVNLLNGKKYIGSTKNFSRRRSEHLNALSKNKHQAKLLQQDWNLDKDVFRFVEIEKVESKHRITREQYWMDFYRSYNSNFGYNTVTIAAEITDLGGKPVYQFSMDGNFIARFNSRQDAADYAGIDSSGLSKCARGKYRYYGGYIWSEVKNLDPLRVQLANNPIKRTNESKLKMSIKARERTDTKKPIIQMDKNMNIINEWDSTQSAQIHLGLNIQSGSISRALHSNCKFTAYGFFWKFKNE